MSNKNGRQLSKKGHEAGKGNKSFYGGNGTGSVSSDYGNMRAYGLSCLNKTARKSGIKDYANVYVGRRGHLKKIKAAYGW